MIPFKTGGYPAFYGNHDEAEHHDKSIVLEAVHVFPQVLTRKRN
jgi:hypothetical protein